VREGEIGQARRWHDLFVQLGDQIDQQVLQFGQDVVALGHW
jgi:hypothetical protein